MSIDIKISKSNPTTYKKSIDHNQVAFIPGMQARFNIQKSIKIIPLVFRMPKSLSEPPDQQVKEEKNHMTISTDPEKTCEKNPTPFHDKNSQELEIEENLLNLIKDIYKNPTVEIIRIRWYW